MKINFQKLFILVFGIFISPLVIANENDCITEAAQCFRINPLLIKAIIWQESRNHQDIINKNKNNTIDIGIMQINSIHFNSLKLSGINEKILRNNSCANIFSGTWILKQIIQRYGYTWKSIGYYHSSTHIYYKKYVENIISIITQQTDIIKNIRINRNDKVRKKFTCY